MKESSSSSDNLAVEGLIASPASQGEKTPWTIDGSMPLPVCPNDTIRRADVVTMWNEWRCGLPADKPFRHSDGMAFLNKLNNIPRAEASSPARPRWQDLPRYEDDAPVGSLMRLEGGYTEGRSRPPCRREHGPWVNVADLESASSPARPQLEQSQLDKVREHLIRLSKGVIRPAKYGIQIVRRDREDGSIEYQVFADTKGNGRQIAWVQSSRHDAEFIAACLAQASLFPELLAEGAVSAAPLGGEMQEKKDG